ncbi:hypothetical protein ES703_76485 [subsurface metagenome]
MSGGKARELKVFDATIQGFAQACINLNIIAGYRVGSLISGIGINQWYPFERLREIERLVIETYETAGPILERVGIEMMLSWYNSGTGKKIIKKGAEFLHFQSSSRGYASVVKGPEEFTGRFELVEIDEKKGKALVHSTTPFNKDLERGVLIGGMSAPGDLDYIDVNNDEDKHYFKVDFSRCFTKYDGLLKERERDKAFWTATNKNLVAAYKKLHELTDEFNRRLTLEETIIKISSRFVRYSNIDYVVNTSLKDIGRLCGASRAYLYQFYGDKGLMDNTHEWRDREIKPQMNNLKNLSQEMYPWLMGKLRSGETIHILDMANLPPEATTEKKILEIQDIKSLLVMPVFIKGELAEELEHRVEERTAELTTANDQLKREIKERKWAEEELRESNEKLRNIFNSSPYAITVTELRGEIIECNQVTLDLCNFSSKEELIGKNAFEFISPEEQQKALEKMKGILKHGFIKNIECTLLTKDRREYQGELSVSVIRDLSGEPKAFVCITKDITERKQAEEEKKKLETRLQRAQKMEAVGTLAGGVAHDLNNILSGIVSVPELLLMQLPEDSPLRNLILIMQESGKKAAAVVQDLLTLARRGAAPAEVVNLNDIICKYLKSLEHEKLKSYQPGVEVETDLDAGLLNISGSHVHLSKTVMNLVSNAAEAMPEGGKVHAPEK